MLEKIKHQLVVSCQALPDEPLHSSTIMARLALAAKEGGASGIRANSVVDIKAIKQAVDLPVIGIIKRDYPDSEVFITATKKEIDELAQSGCEMIALDATSRKRPNNETLADLVNYTRDTYPTLLLMADVALVSEAKEASDLGFDCVSSTLIGYTKESQHLAVEADDFAILKDMLAVIDVPLIAEGNINTPDKLARVLDIGAYSAVVGSAITRPQLITKSFVDAIQQERP